jgi:hypothetical protein
MSGPTTNVVLVDICAERDRQDQKWGKQSHPDGTGEGVCPGFKATAEKLKAATAYAAQEGRLTWRHILKEEVAEAVAESDRARLRAELVQVAAVAVAWIEDLDGRTP